MLLKFSQAEFIEGERITFFLISAFETCNKVRSRLKIKTGFTLCCLFSVFSVVKKINHREIQEFKPQRTQRNNSK